MNAIEARDLTRTWGENTGISGADLTVAHGEIVALVGPNGAGKSTLMSLLLGMLRPQRGTASIDGVDVRAASPEVWRRVGHLVDAPLAYPELTVRQNLELNARLRGFRGTAIADFRLEQYANRKVRALSLGNAQRVGLAAALQHDPTVIVLDEPTNGLDPAGVILLRERLLARADAGAGILVSSHHLDEVARIAHRIAVVNAGRMIGELDPHAPELERVFFEHVRLDDERRAA
ncbi:MAG TPA: ABC transporter ATP-binding protein [Pseudolysinimonas sp.]|jgi:ABC-2 type transport system ATP-binding protein|nr:ABC transporter ATP-binding protein [Pseudolysinimonas sp.]